MGGAQFQPDSAGCDAHYRRDLELTESKGAHLHCSKGSLGELLAQHVHENVCGDVDQQPELIGSKRVAGHPALVP
jgi:hypothetical protein